MSFNVLTLANIYEVKNQSLVESNIRAMHISLVKYWQATRANYPSGTFHWHRSEVEYCLVYTHRCPKHDSCNEDRVHGGPKRKEPPYSLTQWDTPVFELAG